MAGIGQPLCESEPLEADSLAQLIAAQGTLADLFPPDVVAHLYPSATRVALTGPAGAAAFRHLQVRHSRQESPQSTAPRIAAIPSGSKQSSQRAAQRARGMALAAHPAVMKWRWGRHVATGAFGHASDQMSDAVALTRGFVCQSHICLTMVVVPRRALGLVVAVTESTTSPAGPQPPVRAHDVLQARSTTPGLRS